MRKICIAILLLPALAWAEPKTASDWYNEGENQYNLGAFDKAVDAFKQGFALESVEGKKAAYLFNIAQSYRMANDCKNAFFFYKRFLAVKENDPKPLSPKMRKDVQDRINDLEACAHQADAISKKPPNNLRPDDPGSDNKPATPADDPAHKEPGKTVAVAGEHGGEDDKGGEPETHAVHPARPHVFMARVIGGGSKLSAGDTAIPVQAAFVVNAGYPISLSDKLMIDVGAAFSFTPVPYTNAMTQTTPAENKTAQFFGLMANAGITYEVAPKIGIRGDLGLGALLIGNISNSLFTDMQPTSGTLAMFHVRVGLSAEYAVTPNFIVTVPSLAFSYSPPKDGLADDIKSITGFDFMLGVSYRL
jgi:hypothetical protein